MRFNLYIQKPNGERKLCNNIKYTYRILPAKGQVLSLSGGSGLGLDISSKDLNDPEKGYIKDGKVTMHFTIFDS